MRGRYLLTTSQAVQYYVTAEKGGKFTDKRKNSYKSYGQINLTTD